MVLRGKKGITNNCLKLDILLRVCKVTMELCGYMSDPTSCAERIKPSLPNKPKHEENELLTELGKMKVPFTVEKVEIVTKPPEWF